MAVFHARSRSSRWKAWRRASHFANPSLPEREPFRSRRSGCERHLSFPGEEMRRWRGWKAFVAWSLAGGLLVFSVLTGFSIGLLVLPFALAAVLVTAKRASAWPEAIGVVAGAGVVSLVVAFLSRDYEPCPESGVRTLSPGEMSIECGGFDPMPWLIGGIALVGVSLAAHVFVRARRSPGIANPS